MAETPFIPEQITVHLGRPSDTSARNVTVNFPDYIKGVASSELYPSWPTNALRANIYAIISFTLNRIYTEWYRSQGYNFDITNSIQFDQSFNPDGEVFQSISDIVDEIFNDYISRQGSVEPLFAVYCDGIEVANCGGLTQWGSVDLANQGRTPYEILTYFYGNNIDIVQDAPVLPNIPSYPGTPLQLGDGGNDVAQLQIRLNRISRNYPAIPKIYPVSTIYDLGTFNAVKEFQSIFNLPVTGITDKATWYKIEYIFSSVKKLAQLNSEGLTLEEVSLQYPETLERGATGVGVQFLQYFLEVVGAYYNDVLPVTVTGTFDEATENSLRSFQQVFGLPQTGVIDEATWDELYAAYVGIVESIPPSIESENAVLYPGRLLTEGQSSEYVRILQQFLSYLSSVYSDIPDVSITGYFGPVTRAAVTAFQRRYGINQTGSVGAETWNEISNAYTELREGVQKRPGQFPGYTISAN